MLARSAVLAERVRGLLGPGDVVLLPGSGAAAPGHAGRAWCPTPGALATLARAGTRVPAAPPVDVLRRVNHRRFCAELGSALEGARYVTTAEELDETIASTAGTWVLKQPFGFAGRGQLQLVVGAGGRAPTVGVAAAWIEVVLGRGEGLQVEPWVERAGDFALHGYVSAAGAVTLGEPTSQYCDPLGAWISSERADEGALAPAERAALGAAAEETAAALAGAGYFGPFGIDAFRFRDAGGGVRFNPRCEINARYAMGWALGMGERRPDLEEAERGG